jgi:excisionase family DNA binding protein
MQAAKRLGIGRSTLYLLLADEQLESVHIGARRLVPVDGLERFVERLRRGETDADTADGTLGRSAAVPRPSRRRRDGPSQPMLPLST